MTWIARFYNKRDNTYWTRTIRNRSHEQATHIAEGVAKKYNVILVNLISEDYYQND